MRKPNIGEVIQVPEFAPHQDAGRVLAVFDPPLETWWPGPYGEAKMGLMDVLETHGDDPAKAEWYVVVENENYQGETAAFASFEVKVH